MKENSTNYLKNIGMQIRLERVRLSMSQEDLAYKSNLDRTYIGSIERGKRNPSILNLVKISRSFNMSVSDLLKRVENLEENNG